MGKSIGNLLGFGVGDILTLSDIQTQKEFNELSMDFRIKEVRTYKEPNDIFTYTGYVLDYDPRDGEDPIPLMLIIRQMCDDFDLMLYYLDQEGSMEDFKEHILKSDEQDFKDNFEVTVTFKDKTSDITWDKKAAGTFFGIETTSNSNSDHKTIAEYITSDDNDGNPFAFIEWTGDHKKGFVEIWYGCQIRLEDAELFHTNKEA